MQVNHLGNEEVLTAQQVTVAMLSHLKVIAETALKTKVTDCVISVSGEPTMPSVLSPVTFAIGPIVFHRRPT